MLRHCSTLLLTLFLLQASFGHAELPPVQSVEQINLERYAGKWYEIAAFPMFFQRQCIGDTTAEYAALPNGDIDVTNRCRTESGFDQAKGRAWPATAGQTARLKVSFFWPFRSDYWVIGLDADYRWAVVGNPNRKFLWILSRTPQMSPAEFERALKAAANQGFPLDQLKLTRQTETAP